MNIPKIVSLYEIDKTADEIMLNDHNLSRLRKDNHEKAIMTLCQRVQDELPFALSDAEENQLMDFLVVNY